MSTEKKEHDRSGLTPPSTPPPSSATPAVAPPPVSASSSSVTSPGLHSTAAASFFGPSTSDDGSTPSQTEKASQTQEQEFLLHWVVTGKPDSHQNSLSVELRQRLLEGHGECTIKIGVDRQGRPKGISESHFQESLDVIARISKDMSAASSLIIEKIVRPQPVLKCAEILVRRWGEDHYIDMRIVVCGNVDSGKSTFVGVCTKGILDNGRGFVRQRVFKHKHEVETGRTSAISEQLMGFDSVGNVVNYAELAAATEANAARRQITSKEIAEKSAKIITFFDLAGHEKYLKTTVLGIVGSIPDYGCIVISANNGVQRMTKEHLGLLLALKIPFFIVITRIDMCPAEVLKNTTDDITKILKQPKVNKLPLLVREDKDVVISAKNIKDDRLVPIFHVSNVTAENLNLVQRFLNLLPIRRDWDAAAKLPAEAVIDSTYYVTGVGTVVGTMISQGSFRPNDTVHLGPDSNGHFRQAVIKSIHVKQCNVEVVSAGTAACFALKKERRSDIRRGMALLDIKTNPAASWEFEAEVVVLYHSTTIQSNYQPVIHCGAVRQSCSLILNDRDVLRTGDKAHVRFRFMYKPEYIRVGAKMIFREGRTKGLGTIINVFPIGSTPASATTTTSTSTPAAATAASSSSVSSVTLAATSAPASSSPSAPMSTAASSVSTTTTTTTSTASVPVTGPPPAQIGGGASVVPVQTTTT